MAKDKDKKKKDEELNEEEQNDIQDADDSFGLPDIDYKPLEEGEEEDDNASVEDESDASEETSEYSDEDELQEDEVEEVNVEGDVPPPVQKRFEYEEDSSPAGKIILAILAIVVIAGAVWYFGFYRPQQAEEARIAQEQAEKQREAEEAARLERERQAALERERQQQEAEEQQAEETPAEGTINTITERTNRYYVVIGSFIDVDLAMDLAKELSAKGVSSNILSPTENIKFYRLALEDFGTWSEAQSRADELKGEYGENTWVLRY